MKQILLSLLISIFIVACYGPKKATEQTNKALTRYPETVAAITRAAFPCTTIKADTIISTKDSVVFIDCPEQPENTGPQYLIDTIHITTTKVLTGKTIRVPVNLPVRTVTIIQKIEDSAKIYLLRAATLKLQEDKNKLSTKVGNRNTALKWLIIALLCSLGLNFIQFKKKLFFK